VAAAVAWLRAEIRRFVGDPPAEAELAPVRRAVRQVFPMRFESLHVLVC
jgi:hypothetical protein